jgi:hypothetical protein
MAQPIAWHCFFMYAMLSHVHFAGGTPLAIAAFSAGKPNASQPMGIIAFAPFMRMKWYSASLMV